MEKGNLSERGQAIILLVLGVIGLLGFAALAIDGGRVYIDRRSMQNASDTGSMAGGLEITNYFRDNAVHHSTNWSCSSIEAGATSQAQTAAIARVSSNGYTVDAGIDEANGDFNGVRITCHEDNLGGFVDRYVDVETFVTAQTPSSLVQFVFGGPLMQTVISKVRVRPQTTFGYGASIVALNPAGCQGNQNGAQFDGNNKVTLKGGGIISEGCLGKNGNGDVLVENGGISWGGETSDFVQVGPGVLNPGALHNSMPLPDNIKNIRPPDCSGLDDKGLANSGGQLLPGKYTSIDVGNDEMAILAPGLYCITTNGVKVAGQGSLLGFGVTIYIMNGDFDTTGGSHVKLNAPGAEPDPSPAIPNVLIYLAEGNHGTVNLLGDSESYYLGTVFAPDGTVEVGGTGSLLPTFSTQVIGWDVFVHGNTTIDIVNDQGAIHQVPSTVDLQK
jgi:hypothetical protein